MATILKGAYIIVTQAPLDLGKDAVKAGEGLGNAIYHHPVESAIIAGGTAAVAAGVVFTGGVDAAAAPAEESAVIGAAEATDAGASALAASDAGAAVGGDAGAVEGEGIASRIAGASKTIGSALSKYVARPLGVGLKYALPIGVAGFGVGEGLSLASGGIANLESSILQGKESYTYGTGFLGLPTTEPTGGTTASSGGTTTSSSLLSSPAAKVLLIAGAALLLYEVVKHR